MFHSFDIHLFIFLLIFIFIFFLKMRAFKRKNIYKQNKLKAKRNNSHVMMQEIHRAAVPQRAYMVYNTATNRFLWDFSAKRS